MRANLFISLLMLVLFLNCNDKTHKGSVEERLKTIENIHALAKKNLDSVFPNLKHTKKLIAQGGISDSLKGVNDFFLGAYYADNSQLDSAAVYLYDATETIQKQITSPRQVDYFNFAWNVHYRLGKYGDCLALSRRYESLLDTDSKYTWRTLTHFMDENVHKKTKDYESAIKSNDKRVKILEKAGDTTETIKALMSQARSRYYLDDKKRAFAILDDIVKKEKTLSNDINRKLFGDYAAYLSEEKKYSKSLTYHLKSLKYKKKLKNSAKKRHLATSFSNIAGVYIELGQYNKAAKYIDSVIALDLNNTSKSLQRNVLKHQLKLGMVDKSKFHDALNQLDSIFSFQNKLYKEKYDTELAALTEANENEKLILKEKQDAEIQSLKLQSRQQFLILGIGLIGIIGYLFFRQRKLGFERQQLQMQRRLLRSQMNPHFTSNILYSIQNLVKKSPENASNYLVKFSRLLRLVLENSMNNHVQLEDELEALKKYFDLQSFRYDSKFTHEIILNNIDEDDLIFIPPMLIQPIAENSIEHGLLDLDRPGNLKIILTKKHKFLECIVEDNGKGITETTNTVKHSASTKLINDFLRKTTKSGLKVINKSDIDSNQTGVLVTFLIPYKLTDDD